MTYFKGQGYNQPAPKVTPAAHKVVKSGEPAAGVAKLGFKGPGGKPAAGGSGSSSTTVDS
jgi:hypothetical protein